MAEPPGKAPDPEDDGWGDLLGPGAAAAPKVASAAPAVPASPLPAAASQDLDALFGDAPPPPPPTVIVAEPAAKEDAKRGGAEASGVIELPVGEEPPRVEPSSSAVIVRAVDEPAAEAPPSVEALPSGTQAEPEPPREESRAEAPPVVGASSVVTPRVAEPAAATSQRAPVSAPPVAGAGRGGIGVLAAGAAIVALVAYAMRGGDPKGTHAPPPPATPRPPASQPAGPAPAVPPATPSAVLEPAAAAGPAAGPVSPGPAEPAPAVPAISPPPLPAEAPAEAPVHEAPAVPSAPVDAGALRTAPAGSSPEAAAELRKVPVSPEDRPPLGGIGATGIHVDRLSLGLDMSAGECTGKSSGFSVAARERVNVCFRVVHQRGRAEEILVTWQRDAGTARRVKVGVPNNHAYRTRAQLVLRPEYVGQWTVRLLASDGAELGAATFQVVP
jgi:hypothetical protein